MRMNSTWKLLASLCCLVVLSASGMYVYLYEYHYDSSAKFFHVDLPGLEEVCEGVSVNGTCSYSFMAKSWNACAVTRYKPIISANCDSLWAGEDQEVSRIKSLLASWRSPVSDEQFLEELRNCTYVEELLYNNFYTSPVETAFPVAFLLTIHDYPQQVVRLLRVIYRPHNVYCIHVDAKAKQELIEAFRSLSSCVPNILMPHKLVHVFRIYGESVLESQLSCLEVLHSAQDTWRWRYIINLCGTELPLVTNRQIVERLEQLKNTTYMFTDDFPDSMRNERLGTKYKQKSASSKPYKSNERFGEAPYGMQVYKSTTYVIMSYPFAEFVLTHPKAIAFRNYIKGGSSAEEQFYISLFHLPEAPIGKAPIHQNVAASIWMYSRVSRENCNALEQHDLCIAGVGTMKYLEPMTHCHCDLFFNKYLQHYDHVIMDCMEKKIIAKNKLEYMNDCN